MLIDIHLILFDRMRSIVRSSLGAAAVLDQAKRICRLFLTLRILKSV